MSSCGDGRLARPSGAKLRPHCLTTNPAKFLHLQVLMWQDLPKNYTTFGAIPGQADRWLFRLCTGLALRGLEGFAFGRRSRLPLLSKVTNSDGFQPRRFRLTTLFATSAAKSPGARQSAPESQMFPARGSHRAQPSANRCQQTPRQRAHSSE